MAQNRPTYFPLKLLYDFDHACDPYGKPIPWRYVETKSDLEKHIHDHLPDDKTELLQDIACVGLKDTEPKSYIKNLTRWTTENLLDIYGDKLPNMNLSSEMKDMLVYPIILEIWEANKQVYKPDAIFINALAKTKKFSLTRTDIEHLPVNTFFVDLTDVAFASPYEGVFMHIYPLPAEVYVMLYLLTPDGVFSHYLRCQYDDDGENLTGSISQLMSDDHFAEGSTDMLEYDLSDDVLTIQKKEITSGISRLDLTRMMFQLICYMSSKEPDIDESTVSKNTYRKPTGKPQNRYSEVQTFDVGVKYGNSLRTLLQTVDSENRHKKKHRKNKNPESQTESKVRKRPIPHFRSAHWQRYWIGEGRTTPVVKWIEPTFVGFKSDKATNVIIHRVT